MISSCEILTKRRIISTLLMALVPLALGAGLYAYWLYEYFINYNISSLSGNFSTIILWLMIISFPANFLALIFLFTPWKKNNAQVRHDQKLKRKFSILAFLLISNYIIAALLSYNYTWLSSSVRIELVNNYQTPLHEIRIALPNGDGLYMDVVGIGKTGVARIFPKMEGTIEIFAKDKNLKEVRAKIIAKVSHKTGATVKISLKQDFTITIISPK